MVEKIGVNAGIVWNILTNGSLDLKALRKVSRLTEKDLYAALGWLAREEKIYFFEGNTETFVALS